MAPMFMMEMSSVPGVACIGHIIGFIGICQHQPTRSVHKSGMLLGRVGGVGFVRRSGSL